MCRYYVNIAYISRSLGSRHGPAPVVHGLGLLELDPGDGLTGVNAQRLGQVPSLGQQPLQLARARGLLSCTWNGATKYFSSPVNIFPTYDRFERVPLGDGPPGVGEHLGPVLQLRPGGATANLHTP